MNSSFFNTTDSFFKETFDLSIAELIFQHYQEPHRHYHNLNHIEQLINLIDKKDYPKNLSNTLKLTAYFHDIIYVPGATDNEEKSVGLMTSILDVEGKRPITFVVTQIILATKQVFNPNQFYSDRIIEDFLRMDAYPLLCEDQKIYDKYKENIRKEYLTVFPLSQYIPGRIKFLQSLAFTNQLIQNEIQELEIELKSI